MEFSEISRTRREVLLISGLEKGVLKDFIDKRRKVLLLNNSPAKNRGLDNPKITTKEAAKKIAQFDEKSDKTIRDYFQAYFSSRSDLQALISEESTEEALINLMAHEMGFKSMPQGSMQHYCVVLFSTVMHAEIDTDSILFKYLASEIGSQRLNESEELIPGREHWRPEEVEQILRANELTQTDLDTATDTGLVLAALRQDLTAEHRALIVKQVAKRVAAGGDFDRLAEAIEEVLSVIAPGEETASRVNATAVTFVDYKQEFDGDLSNGIAVLAFMKDVRAHDVRFLEPLAIEVDGKFYGLPRPEFKRIFPESGDLVWPGKSDFKGFQPGDVGLFFVDVQVGSGHKNSATVRRSERQLLEVLQAPVRSDHLVELRRFFVSNKIDIGQRRMWVATEDGILLKPKYGGNVVDTEEPVGRFLGCRLLSLGSRLYLLDLGVEAGVVDLSSPRTYLNRMIKAGFFSKADFSQADLKRFVELVGGASEQIPGDRLQEIKESLEVVLRNEDLANELLSAVVDRGFLKEMIDEKIEEITQAHEVGKEVLYSEIRKLTRERNDLQKGNQKLVDEHRRTLSKFSLEWKKEFDRAVEKSAEKLSELAWFKGGVEAVGAQLPDARTGQNFSKYEPSILAESIERSTESIGRLASQFRLEGTVVESLFRAVQLMSRAGMSLVFRGAYARTFGRAFIARMDLDAAHEFFVEPALVRPYPELLLPDREFGKVGLLLNSFDVSPISLYAPSLIDQLQRIFFSRSPFYGVTILTSDESGASLPVPDSLSVTTCTVDVDSISLPKEGFLDSLEQKISGSQFISKSSQYAAQFMWGKLQHGSEDTRLSDLIAAIFDRGYVSRYASSK